MLSAKLKEAAGNSADATLYVDDVFSTWLYTGNGSTQTINNGIDLAGKGGMVWVKRRSTAQDNDLFDTVRGVNNVLWSNNTSPQVAMPPSLTAFNSNGFNLGSNTDVNKLGDTTVSWTFRKAAKFFDVVTYTGTGSARTIAHSLGIAPGMVIVKRTDVSADWQVYSNGLPSAAYSMQINLTNPQASAPTVWNSTAPTSSVFSVGTDATVNASGGTYVAYLYAHDTSSTGIIQCGSLVGGAATVNLGWEPQYLLIKSSNMSGAGDNWRIIDTMRGFVAPSGISKRLYANTSDSEQLNGDIYLTSTGFKTDFVGSDTYIYMAIRRPNKPPTTGTQVYNAIARTGTGAAATVTGVGFTPDSIFSDPRVVSNNGFNLQDRLRGTLLTLFTAAATAETSMPDSVTSFNMDGVSLGADGTGGGYNWPSWGYIEYFFKRALGFFDEVCYTGTGTTGQTYSHNLTVVPEMMIVKSRTVGSSWYVYVSSIGNTNTLVLNSTAATAVRNVWGDTTPTSSVFSVGVNGNGTNNPSQTYVAYLFATLAGISKVGSYTGNGTGQAIACGFGSGGARFVLIKRTDSTGGWYTYDSARGLTSGSSPYLLLNSTAAEVTGNNGVYASSGGFTLGSTASTTTNINAATYIFLAVA